MKTFTYTLAVLLLAGTSEAAVDLFPSSPSPTPTASNQQSVSESTPSATPSKFKPRKVIFKAEDGIETDGKLEQSMTKKAVQTIRWSGNPNPKEAADEDFDAIWKYCDKLKVAMIPALVTVACLDGNHPKGDEYEQEIDDQISVHAKSSNSWQHFDDNGKLVAPSRYEDTGYELDANAPSGVDKVGQPLQLDPALYRASFRIWIR